jgi:hypothetical protein
MREGTVSSGFGYDSVRDAEGSCAAGDGAPPWHGATWTARMRSAVSEIRRQTETSDPIMAARPHSAAEFGRVREQGLVVVQQRTVLGSGAASGLIQTRAPCCDVPRSAAGGGRPDSGCTGPLGCLANAPFAKLVGAPTIILNLKRLESGRWRRGGQFDSGAASTVTVARHHTRMRHAARPCYGLRVTPKRAAGAY